MRPLKLILFTLVVATVAAGLLMAQDDAAKAADEQTLAPPAVTLQISGPGAVDPSTIKVGEPVNLDLYFSNDKDRRGFSMGFRIISPDIKRIEHIPDSGNGLNDAGDVKGYNGFENKSIFDLGGVWVNEKSWDGILPDTAGLAGVTVRTFYEPHDMQKVVSMAIRVLEPGTLVVDSSFFPPGGYWQYGNTEKAAWGGPYEFKVVEE
ncbi:hypothetical protein GF420_14170 [candidate division GN15 bacterium]|nr:hypothetical protein [candidate division GN15 bacterium]